ncbi:hypothetical protein [Noviherbaspirillum malthae]|uniref:hypothetical protein n=1 Tax=Noviherbaspirillum malthae TaxID=1260987 RepID=UPI00188FBF19|nr:hypothetical protein [Noviherbaspirillum malthae]
MSNRKCLFELLGMIEGELLGTEQIGFRKWFRHSGMHVYLRIEAKRIRGKAYRSLTLSNVEFDDVARGLGLFSALLVGLEWTAFKRSWIFTVADISSRRVLAEAIARGYVHIGDHSDHLNYALLFDGQS